MDGEEDDNLEGEKRDSYDSNSDGDGESLKVHASKFFASCIYRLVITKDLTEGLEWTIISCRETGSFLFNSATSDTAL
jgi:hypothetical protein